MGWKLYQLAVVAFFLCANVYWEWGGNPLAVGVLGGIVSWYTTGLLAHLFERLSNSGAEREL